jgi:TPP-dependent indolepyruvate ferredoxin oxidoreductase alpha subunit
MAERSYALEIQQLWLGAGAGPGGQGILAITKALPENGVGCAAGYQGAPVSNLMDVLADASHVMAAAELHRGRVHAGNWARRLSQAASKNEPSLALEQALRTVDFFPNQRTTA